MKPPFLLESSIQLDRLFEIYRNSPALITPDGVKSFGEIEKKLQVIVANLTEAGVHQGHRVALHRENNESHLYLFLASWIMNFLYIPLDFKAPPGSLLAGLPVDYLITNVPAPADAQYAVIHPDKILAIHPDRKDNILRPAVPFQQESCCIFTSGSTGKPRGIVHTVGSFIYSALGTNEFIGLDASDRWLLSLPLFHVGGALIWVRTLLAGAACILPGPSQSLEDSLRQHLPSVISLVPAQLMRLLDREEMVPILKSMKVIMLGGAPSPDWLIDRSLDMGIPIMPTYGCTESCAQITGVVRGSAKAAYHTAGQAVPYRELRLDSDGIIRIGGKTLFKRYLDEPASRPFDANGFFKTADSGSIDSQGNLVIAGRTDSVFISGGENISPQEIETVLLKQDGVITAIVVPVPHREFGQTPWAFVETSGFFSEKSMLDKVRNHLPGYKLPKRIIRLSPNERQGKMKYSRQTLARLARRLAEDNRPTQLYFEEAGSPDVPVIVFLHGFMGRARSWKTIMESLADTFRCIAFDLPGHGSSLFRSCDRLEQLQGIDDTARLIFEDLDRLGIQRFALYGYSMGGRIAQHMAIMAPGRISRLILESASFGISDPAERALRLKKDRSLLSGIKTPDDFRSFLNNWYCMPLFRTLPETPFMNSLIEDKIGHPVAEYQQALNLLSVGIHDFLAEKLAACHIPIHYFCGEQDEAYRQTAAQTVSYLPEMTVKIFPNASHNISIQYPEEIARAICEILI